MKVPSSKAFDAIARDYQSTVKDLKAENESDLSPLFSKAVKDHPLKNREALEQKAGTFVQKAKEEISKYNALLTEVYSRYNRQDRTPDSVRRALAALKEIGEPIEEIVKTYSLFRKKDKQTLNPAFAKVYHQYRQMVHNQEGWLKVLNEEEKVDDQKENQVAELLSYPDFREVSVRRLKRDISKLKGMPCEAIGFQNGRFKPFNEDSSLIDLALGLKAGRVLAKVGGEKVPLENLVAGLSRRD